MRIDELQTIEDQLNFFFGEKKHKDYVSTLQKGLKELDEIWQVDLAQNQAFSLLCWSLIDLLSRYHSGQLESKGSLVRIKKYLKLYFRHDRKDTQTLLLFRNAVVHSVSLYAFDSSSKKEVRFRLTSSGKLVEYDSPVRICINVKQLYVRLNESVLAFQKDLIASEKGHKRFQKVFKKIGYLHQ